VKALEWVASDDWEYRWIADLYAIEDQGKNWSTDRYWLYYNGQRLGKFGTFDAASSAAQADYERRILSALTAGKPHPDDEAVDRFAAAMKAKLKWEREERGRHGWNDPSICPESYLARLLIEHLAKGNDGNFEDVANFCMMLHQRGAHPRVLADALTAGKPSGTVEALKRIAQLKEVRRGGGVFDYEPALSAMEMYEIAFDALSALTAGKPEQAVPSEDEEDGLPCVICGKPIQGQAVMDKNGELGCQGCAGENPGREHLRLIPAAPTAGGGDE